MSSTFMSSKQPALQAARNIAGVHLGGLICPSSCSARLRSLVRLISRPLPPTSISCDHTACPGFEVVTSPESAYTCPVFPPRPSALAQVHRDLHGQPPLGGLLVLRVHVQGRGPHRADDGVERDLGAGRVAL